LLADAVLGLSARAVEVLVERARRYAGAAQGGDDEAGIGAVQRVLGLADDPALAAPAIPRAIAEVAEDARRLARGEAKPLGLGERLGEDRLEADVAGQAEHVVDPVRLAPRHQRVIGKTTVGAQRDAHPRPRLADLG